MNDEDHNGRTLRRGVIIIQAVSDQNCNEPCIDVI